mgnify:CR=1 FL=1
MKNRLTALFTLLFLSTVAFAQIPTEVPKPSEEPIDLSNPADVIIYIILPLSMILFFFLWRKKRKK